MKDQAWFIIMTTEGGITLRDVLGMDDKERTYWYEKCRDHNERIEDQTKGGRRP